MESNNQKLIRMFTYLKTLRDIENNKHSSNALKNVIESLEVCSTEIVSGEQAKSILGVGSKSASYINTILKNTDSNKFGIYELDNLQYEDKQKLIVITEMIKFPGIGISTAIKYYDQGINTIPLLRIFLKSGKGTKRQQIGSIYSEEFKKRIPKDKITFFGLNFQKKLKEFNDHYNTKLNFNILGSYNRNSLTSGDIDILLWSNIESEVRIYSGNFFEYLRINGILKETLSLGSDSYQGVAYIDEEFHSVRIDIKLLNHNNEYFYSVLYFTGPATFNEMMRQKAKELGFKLGNNEMIILSTQERIYVNNEKEIFDILRIPYFIPEDRR
jgi:DNA polymerase (family 10)